MGAWTEAVERKALIIHAQIAAAREIAEKSGIDVSQVTAPYLKLLSTLYSEEFPFAQLTDSSDLVARFGGPAVDVQDPTVSLVISVFSEIRGQIRNIAKSIVGMATDRRVRWPSQLDPHLSGVTRGSLIVGITVVPPTIDLATGQQIEIEGASAQIFESVRQAIKGLTVISHYVDGSSPSETVLESFSDPAVRDTLLVAAARLAPTGRRGIDTVTFYRSDDELTPAVLTPASRTKLFSALKVPPKTRQYGEFIGMLREVDLDARRFEIRAVADVGAIRCVYEARHDALVKGALDSRVKVAGKFETIGASKPRLLFVDTLEVLSRAPVQESFV